MQQTTDIILYLCADPCDENDVRLVDGNQKSNGRLEVCIHGQWGSVCETGFDEVDAQVVCRELGFLAESKNDIKC